MKKVIYSLQILIILPYFYSINICAQTSKAPQGAWDEGYDLDTAYLPEEFHCGHGWVQIAMLDSNYTGTATVIVDYIAIYEINKDGSPIFIDSENYDEFNGELPDYKGGLFIRNPWGSGGKNHPPFGESGYVENGLLTLHISDYPKKVFHFWGNRFKAKPNTNYAVKIKCKIIGACRLNVGLDWWREMESLDKGQNVNNYQAFSSGWYEDTAGQDKEIFERVNR